MARLPGIDSMFAVLQAQTEALAQLPATVTALTSAVRGLADTVHQARDTLASLQRLSARVDGLVADLEEPLRALRPGLERLAVVLDDDAVSELPDTLRQVRSDVLPVLRTLADTHEKVAGIAGSTDRIMGLVDETSRAFSGLPGAGLWGRRRGPAPPAGGPNGPSGPPTVIVVEPEPPER